ncbi:APC family permease [Streptomyces sp. NPDC001828]|uniref:APC family permease n=1 Tax=Streptomyces sp. NPDC001828 TaxID=3364615 RepID=UPI0036779279
MPDTPPARPAPAEPTPAPQFERSMGLVATFSLGFTYLSPLGAVCALLPLGLTNAGPPSIWWIVIVGLGQLLVALVFGEIVSQYPITGGIYPWSRRLWGRRYAWLAAWVYLCALVVSITSITEYAVPFVASLFGFTTSNTAKLLVAVGILLLALLVNTAGTRWLARVARAGFFAEIIGVVALGLYLLIFERHNSFAVFFDAMNSTKDGSYLSGFLSAALVGLFMFYGFEACGDVAEEVHDAGRQIPKAMILTIVFGGISALAAFVGYILSAPDLQAIVDGDIADPVTAIVQASLGQTGSKVFLVVALTAFLSCVLSLQAALSRLIFSFARDGMLPASKPLSTLTSTTRIPRNAMLVACLLPMAVCLWVYAYPGSLPRVTAFAVIGIYLCFQMVVLAALRQRIKGWKPAGNWSLGRAGLPINIAALLYGIAAMAVLALPANDTTGLSFADKWIVLVGLATILATGLLYMLIARPYNRSNTPENDALAIAHQRQESPPPTDSALPEEDPAYPERSTRPQATKQ